MNSIRLTDAVGPLFAGAQAGMDRQIDDPGSPDHGGPVNAAWGIPDPSSAIGLTATLALALVVRRLRPDLAPARPDDGLLLRRAVEAADFLLRCQRPSGLTDLLDCNYDSSPDAGFAVQAMCPVIELGRRALPGHPDLAPVLERVERFTRAATVGMLTGGFHTPNHRWVIAGALARAGGLYPDIDVQPVIETYLAEGIDADEEGFFIERSAGVYDPICDRSLLLLWRALSDEPSRDAALRNLDLNLLMLNADGTAETGLSRRQDYGARSVPGSMALAYLLGYEARPDPRYLAAAQLLWDRGRGDASGVASYLIAAGVDEVVMPDGAFPFDFQRMLPANGIWRMRRGALSVSAFRGATRLMTLSSGQAELAAVKVNQSYFGVGAFKAEALEERGGGVVLTSSGVQLPNRPGYDMPAGRPMSRETFYEDRASRVCRALPPCRSEMTVTPDEQGILLNLRTLDGMEGVTAQMAFDFAPGGEWETADTCLRPAPGQVLFLRRGAGRMRWGQDVIEIDGGAEAHRMWSMRDAEAAPGHVRVLLTFRTPIRHTVRLRVYRAP